MLPAREAFLLRRRHDAIVLDQRRRAVVIEGRDAENPHRRLEYRVNKGRDGRIGRQHHKTNERDHHQHNRQEPKFLSDEHEAPEFGKKAHFKAPQNWSFIVSGAGPGGRRKIQ